MLLHEGFNSNGLVQPKLVLILTNGSVWNVKFNNQMNMIKKDLLIQLPKHRRYHVFQTDSNVLNFVRDDINKSIVQLHEKLSNVGYMNIPSSSIEFKNPVSSFGQIQLRKKR